MRATGLELYLAGSEFRVPSTVPFPSSFLLPPSSFILFIPAHPTYLTCLTYPCCTRPSRPTGHGRVGPFLGGSLHEHPENRCPGFRAGRRGRPAHCRGLACRGEGRPGRHLSHQAGGTPDGALESHGNREL